MGTVHDHVPLKHFAAVLVDFQKCTGAQIEIITHEKYSNGKLMNGIPYYDFLRNLQVVLSTYYPCHQSVMIRRLNKGLKQHVEAVLPDEQFEEPIVKLVSMASFPPLPSSLQLLPTVSTDVQENTSSESNMCDIILGSEIEENKNLNISQNGLMKSLNFFKKKGEEKT